MGCTHYPILADDIQNFLGLIFAWSTAAKLCGKCSRSQKGTALPTAPKRRYLATDTGSRVRQLAERFMGISIEEVEHIDLV